MEGLIRGGLIRGITQVSKKGGLICGGAYTWGLIGGEIRYTFYRCEFIISGKGDMSHFVRVGVFWIDINWTDLGCWRLTVNSIHKPLVVG